MAIGSSFVNALNAGVKQVKSVARRNDERNPRRRLGKRISDAPIPACSGQDLNLLPDPVKVGLKDLSLHLDRIIFFLCPNVSRSRNCSPVVENVRDVANM